MKKAITLLFACILLISFTACSVMPSETVRDTVPLSRDTLRELEIELLSGTLQVAPTDGEPYVEYTLRKGGIVLGDPEIQIQQTDRKTTIAMNGFTVNFGGYVSCDIDVWVPNDVLEELSIEMLSGDTVLSDLSLSELELSLTSGELEAENVSANALDFEATSGSAVMFGCFDAISIDVTSGDFDVAANVLPARIDCNVTSGKVNIDLPEDASGFTLGYERTSGRISSSFETSGSADERSGSLHCGDGACAIEVTITSGSVHIGKW